MTTTQPTMSEALREISEQCEQLEYIPEGGEFFFKHHGTESGFILAELKSGNVYNVAEPTYAANLLYWVMQECSHREWDWEAGRIRDSDSKIVFEFSIQNQYNYAVIASDYSYDSPSHAAVLAFLKAIKGETK